MDFKRLISVRAILFGGVCDKAERFENLTLEMGRHYENTSSIGDAVLRDARISTGARGSVLRVR
jgi:hypothetical protein